MYWLYKCNAAEVSVTFGIEVLLGNYATWVLNKMAETNWVEQK